MNTRELIRAIAGRLYGLTQDQVAEVLDLFSDVVADELMRPHGYVYLSRIGRLHVDYHALQPGGMLAGRYKHNWTLRRVYFRWVPTEVLRDRIRDALSKIEDQS